MQFFRVIKVFCASLAWVVKTDNTYKSVLIPIKEFFIFPKRLPYTPTVQGILHIPKTTSLYTYSSRQSSMLLLIVEQLLFLFYFHP